MTGPADRGPGAPGSDRDPAFEVFNPPALGVPRGWNNGLLAAPGRRILFVAGQTATEAGRTAAEAGGRTGVAAFVDQFGDALDRVLEVVSAAGGRAGDIGRLTIYVTDLDAYRRSLGPLGEAYRARMGRHFPAMTLVEVSGLVDPGALVEIEATAAIPGASGEPTSPLGSAAPPADEENG